MSEDEAHVYAEGVRRGGSLVTARVDESQAVLVESIMQRQGFVDARERGNAYRSGGWEKFDESSPPYVASDSDTDRLRTGTR